MIKNISYGTNLRFYVCSRFNVRQHFDVCRFIYVIGIGNSVRDMKAFSPIRNLLRPGTNVRYWMKRNTLSSSGTAGLWLTKLRHKYSCDEERNRIVSRDTGLLLVKTCFYVLSTIPEISKCNLFISHAFNSLSESTKYWFYVALRLTNVSPIANNNSCLGNTHTQKWRICQGIVLLCRG
jgi:hypothetical protein